MRAALALAFAAALVGCGDDDGGGGGGGGGAPPAARPAPKPDSKNKLQPRMHVEDLVACATPEKASGPACEPLETGSGAPPASGRKKMLADCAPGLYCMMVGQKYSCEKCSERDAIRHDFSDRDFVTDQARDPFYNFVIAPIGVGDTSDKPKAEQHQMCRRTEQFVASNYSYQDLKLVGIVSERTMRKVMMLDSGGKGYIIKRGDCVGKEKAVVKDIGAGYITFVVEEDPDTKRPPQETSVQLHPDKDLPQTPAPEIAPDSSAPIVAPPTTGPRTGLGASSTPPQAPPAHAK